MSGVLRYEVGEEYSGCTVEKIMKSKFRISSKLFKRLKLNGYLRINGIVCRSVDIAYYGDILTADISDYDQSDIIPTDIDFDLLYEDGDILVVDKKSGLSIHPSMGNYQNTLANAVMFHWQKKNESHIFRAVNRLDKNTSGICVIAKSQYAHSILSAQMIDKTFQRKYMAVVHGKLENNYGKIDMPIKREAESIIKRIVAPDGKNAITLYNVLWSDGIYSLLDIELKTGRTHQIRVHFSAIGNPLVGDWLYGKGDEEDIILRHALHAYSLTFRHPTTNKVMRFKTDLPSDIKDIIRSSNIVQILYNL